MTEEIYTCWLPIPPSANHIWKHRKTSFGVQTYLTKEYKAWKELAGLIAPRRSTFAGRVAVIIELYAKPKCGILDLDNLAKPTIDLLRSISVIGGDSRKWVTRIEIVDSGGSPEGAIPNLKPGEDAVLVTVMPCEGPIKPKKKRSPKKSALAKGTDEGEVGGSGVVVQLGEGDHTPASPC